MRLGQAPIEAGALGGSGAAALEAERCSQTLAENGAKVAAARQLLAGLLRATGQDVEGHAGASAAAAAALKIAAGLEAAGGGPSSSEAAAALHGADSSAPIPDPEAAAAPGPCGAAPAPGVAPQGLGLGLGSSVAAPAQLFSCARCCRRGFDEQRGGGGGSGICGGLSAL